MTEILEKKDLISKSFILKKEEVMSDFEWHFIDTTKLQNVLKSMLEEIDKQTTVIENPRIEEFREGYVNGILDAIVIIKEHFKPLLPQEEMVWKTIVGEDILEEER